MKHEFVEFIPNVLEPGTLYVSIEYATAAHLCCCGCGSEVSNPLTPTDWSLTFDGETVSLHPSIGNSSFPCKSHYWLKKGRVVWERPMTPELTAASRSRDKRAKAARFENDAQPLQTDAGSVLQEDAKEDVVVERWIDRIRKRFF